jgi:hypothetical protein
MSITERLARLEQGAEAGKWWHPHKPDKGDGEPQPDRIAGEVLSRETAAGAYGDRELIKVLTVDGVVWRVYAEGSVLERRFEEQDPQAGDLVFVAYKGKVTDRGLDSKGQPLPDYHNWVLVADKGSTKRGDPDVPVAGDLDVPFNATGLPPAEDEQSARDDVAERFGDEPPY